MTPAECLPIIICVYTSFDQMLRMSTFFVAEHEAVVSSCIRTVYGLRRREARNLHESLRRVRGNATLAVWKNECNRDSTGVGIKLKHGGHLRRRNRKYMYYSQFPVLSGYPYRVLIVGHVYTTNSVNIFSLLLKFFVKITCCYSSKDTRY